MDRETVTGAIGGGAQSYVKMLTPNYLTDLKNGGGGPRDVNRYITHTCVIKN